jgi:hypothetical protein
MLVIAQKVLKPQRFLQILLLLMDPMSMLHSKRLLGECNIAVSNTSKVYKYSRPSDYS